MTARSDNRKEVEHMILAMSIAFAGIALAVGAISWGVRRAIK